MVDAHALGVFVRWAHVGAMAVALGGAVLLFALAASGEATRGRAWLAAATGYERIFWAAIGVLAMTGVGNLAEFGTALPPPSSAWGMTLVTKLSSVIGLAVLSVPRTLAVAQLAAREPARLGPRAGTTVRFLYGGTAFALAAILALAVWLAHR